LIGKNYPVCVFFYGFFAQLQIYNIKQYYADYQAAKIKISNRDQKGIMVASRQPNA